MNNTSTALNKEGIIDDRPLNGPKSIIPQIAYYSYHTSKHCSDDAYQDVCQVFILCVGLISYACNPMLLLLIPKRNFRGSNGGLSH